MVDRKLRNRAQKVISNSPDVMQGWTSRRDLLEVVKQHLDRIFNEYGENTWISKMVVQPEGFYWRITYKVEPKGRPSHEMEFFFH